MKRIFAVGAIAAFALVGCSTTNEYGASDEQFSTPSWGTSTSTLNEDPMGGAEPDAANPVSPPMGYGHSSSD